VISLDNIRVFMRAVELGSFSAAGRALRMSSAVVSYRIGVLEQSVGCRLFTRTTRRMSLTESGRIFYERCLDIWDAVERAEASVAYAGATPHGSLKITAPLGLGRRVVAPLISEFRRRHPETDVRLRLSDHLLDLVQEAVDIAVRMARLQDSSFTLRKIGEIERGLFASPAYLDARGVPQQPDDLFGHDCLLLRFPGSQQFRWKLRLAADADEHGTFPVSGPIDADDGDVLTEWALAGHGIILKPRFEVAEHVAAGQLVPVLEEFPPQTVSLGVLYPTKRMISPRLRDLVDLTVEGARRHIAGALALIDEKLVCEPERRSG